MARVWTARRRGSCSLLPLVNEAHCFGPMRVDRYCRAGAAESAVSWERAAMSEQQRAAAPVRERETDVLALAWLAARRLSQLAASASGPMFVHVFRAKSARATIANHFWLCCSPRARETPPPPLPPSLLPPPVYKKKVFAKENALFRWPPWKFS